MHIPLNVILDRETKRSRGFGFVEMKTRSQVEAAIEALDGKEISGKPIAVKEARPKTDSFSGGWGNRSY